MMKQPGHESLLFGMSASKGYFVSTFLFGIMFGIAASSAGINYWHTLFMSVAVFSASAQFASLEFWQSPLPMSTIALSVFLVSTRNILLGMSMAHHFDGHTVGRRVIWLFMLNDPGVVTALNLKQDIDKLSYVTGYGISLMFSWLLSTWVGLYAANLLSNANLSSMDFAGPLVMATMMILFTKGSNANPIPWIVSGIASMLLYAINISTYWILPIAVAAGVFAAIILSDSKNG